MNSKFRLLEFSMLLSEGLFVEYSAVMQSGPRKQQKGMRAQYAHFDEI
jgi:hypothetical protein